MQLQLGDMLGGGGIITAPTTGGLLSATSATTLAWTATLTANGVIVGGGAGVVPTALAAGTNGQLLAGVTSAAPAMVTLSQDCTMTNAGVITCLKTNNVAFTSAATTGIGTSGATIPLLSTANTWTLGQTFTAAAVPTGGIAAAGGFTTSCRLIATGGAPANSSASAYTSQTPVTTEFYFAEVFVPANCTATGVAIYNSATISGNVKVGLANSGGTNVATSASTAMSGTTAYQLVPFTGTYAAVGPATYYIEVFYDNNTVRPNTYTAGSFGVSKATGQTYATGFTAITAPSTFTTALGPVASLY